MAFSEIKDGKVINIIERGADISLPQVVNPTVPVEQPAAPVLEVVMEISEGKVINIIERGVDISLPQVVTEAVKPTVPVTEEVKPTVPVEQPAAPVLGE